MKGKRHIMKQMNSEKTVKIFASNDRWRNIETLLEYNIKHMTPRSRNAWEKAK
jgi:hypothetical protein